MGPKRNVKSKYATKKTGGQQATNTRRSAPRATSVAQTTATTSAAAAATATTVDTTIPAANVTTAITVAPAPAAVATSNAPAVTTPVPVDPILPAAPAGDAATITAFHAFQTLMGLLSGQQAQQGTIATSQPLSLDKGTVFEKFLKATPQEFKGTADPSAAEAWILHMEKIFERLGCTEEQKVSLATYKFDGEAEHWWRMVKRQYEGREQELVWTTFLKLFNEKYFPDVVRQQKQVEFLSLKQGSMSVAEYEGRFTELSRFAPHLVANEEDRAMMFEKGLRKDIYERVTLFELKKYSEIVAKALKAEKAPEEARNESDQQLKRGRDAYQGGQSSGDFSKKRVVQSQMDSGSRQQQPPQRPCVRCGRPHSGGYRCDGTPRTCFNCGKQGHLLSQCRSKGGGNQRQQSYQGQSRQNSQGQSWQNSQGQRQQSFQG